MCARMRHVRDYNSDINVMDNRNPISLISVRTTCHFKTVPPDAPCNTNVNVKLIRRNEISVMLTYVALNVFALSENDWPTYARHSFAVFKNDSKV
jgi:hypothetical protein